MDEVQRSELEELQSLRRAFQELSNFRGWELLANFAKSQVETRKMALLEPAKGFDGLVGQEFTKGEIAGIALFMRFPEIIEEDYGSQIDEKLEELRDNERED